MVSEWMAMERNRIAVMELWPDGPRKEAGLVAARSSLESLARNMREGCSVACVRIPHAQTICRPAHGLAA
jgi:hypothetical protein